MPRAFATREAHRRALNAHFVLLIVGVLAAFAANRFLTPDRFWAHWLALGLAVAFIVHLAVFARGTLATMGKKR